MNGSGKQSHGKTGISPASIRPCPATCPFLGTLEDPYTALAYPSDSNHCFRTHAVAINPAYQQQTCLMNLHVRCARFRDPASVVDGMPSVPTAVTRVKRLALVVLICGLFVTGILQLWPVLSDMWLNGDVLAQVERPSQPVGARETAVPLPTPTLRPTPTAAAQLPTPETTITAVVNAGNLEVYSRPQHDADVTAVLPADATVLLTGRSADAVWGRLRQDDGTTGWISLAFVIPSQPATTLPVVD